MISIVKENAAVRRQAPQVGGPPPIQPDTPRFKFQFRNMDRALRHEALATIFRELHASSLGDQKDVICHIEKIAYLHRQYPKQYKPGASVARARATWVRAVHRHSAELAALLRKPPYGESFLPVTLRLPSIVGDLDRLAKAHNANAGGQRKRAGRPSEGFDWLVANLARFYAERVKGAAEGRPFRLVVRAVCHLLGIRETARTDEAIRKTVARLPDKISPPPT
jgi:hypothetical protein